MQVEQIQPLIDEIGQANRLWWLDLNTGLPKERNRAETLMLIVSELSEALEADRKGLNDDKLTDMDGFTTELADAVIRIFDAAHGYHLDLAEAIVRKLEYNKSRIDHTIEERKKIGGAKY